MWKWSVQSDQDSACNSIPWYCSTAPLNNIFVRMDQRFDDFSCNGIVIGVNLASIAPYQPEITWITGFSHLSSMDFPQGCHYLPTCQALFRKHFFQCLFPLWHHFDGMSVFTCLALWVSEGTSLFTREFLDLWRYEILLLSLCKAGFLSLFDLSLKENSSCVHMYVANLVFQTNFSYYPWIL